MYYQFESKIAVEVLQKKSTWQVVCLVAGIIAVISTVGLFFIEGHSGLLLLSSIIVPLILLSTGLRKNIKIDYVPTQVIVELSSDRILIRYPSVTHYVNGPTTSEAYEFSTDSIESFQYSSELCAVRFWGNPIITFDGKRIDNKNGMQERVVYLPADQAEEICAEMEKYLGISVEIMDE